MTTENKYINKRFDVLSEKNIDIDALEIIDFQYPESGTLVTIKTKEFTSVCPWTGLPDTAELLITYLPAKKLLEMKSLKYYLLSFRNVGILQEHAVNRIIEDLRKILKPKFIEIEARFESRGGLDTIVKTKYEVGKSKNISQKSF
ncbi:MAG TPA: NADPH-dependent 7-cyano-7-deazaguanine reductase QueF [bacterium]|nr:NADPH-dependent 7-cyano-7-deazaguanine reductase QueF [bacterium]